MGKAENDSEGDPLQILRGVSVYFLQSVCRETKKSCTVAEFNFSSCRFVVFIEKSDCSVHLRTSPLQRINDAEVKTRWALCLSWLSVIHHSDSAHVKSKVFIRAYSYYKKPGFSLDKALLIKKNLPLPETNSKSPRKWMVGRLSRFLLGFGLFSGANLLLVSGSVFLGV